MNKVKLDTIKPWIGKRITELLGMEDDVVEEFVNNQLEADTVCKMSCMFYLHFFLILPFFSGLIQEKCK